MNGSEAPETAVEYRRDAVAGLLKGLESFLLVTMPDLRKKASSYLPSRPYKASLFLVRSLEAGQLAADLGRLPEAAAVVGLGGGAAMDVAKYFAWRKELPLYLVPSAASVDAAFTPAAALRRGGAVFYTGTVKPRKILVDFSLIREAPPQLNRGGLGDLLSCHTALYDWRLAAAAGYEPPWNEPLAAGAAALLERLRPLAPALYRVTEEAIRVLMEGYRWVAQMERRYGHCRFEEGSEHFFAYNLEYRTGKKFRHGPLVCLGVAAISLLQENAPERAWSLVRDAGVDISLPALGLSWSEVEQALATLAGFAESRGLPYSVIKEQPVTPRFLHELNRFLKERDLL